MIANKFCQQFTGCMLSAAKKISLQKFHVIVMPGIVCCNRSIIWLMYILLTTSGGYYTHPFSGSFSGTIRVSRYQKGKTNLDFTEARGSEWQWHQLGHMQVCTWLQTDNHASTPPLSFLQAGCPSCCPTNSVKALKVVISSSNTGKKLLFEY